MISRILVSVLLALSACASKPAGCALGTDGRYHCTGVSECRGVDYEHPFGCGYGYTRTPKPEED